MQHPNLHFMFSDEHRRQSIGCYDNPDVRTPALDGPWMLFDNDEDPHQLRNLAHDPTVAALREGLDAALDEWMARTGDALEPVDTLMARLNLTGAWGEREAYLHRPGTRGGDSVRPRER